MTPWVYEFRWETGHILFLLLFLSVAITVAAAFLAALYRSSRDRSPNLQNRIIWKAIFDELPREARSCRHELAGEVRNRPCPNGFNCRTCVTHALLLRENRTPISEFPAVGLEIPEDRLYHRGHTWIKPESEDSVRIGLDDLGKRLAGSVDQVIFPTLGDKVEVNGVCCTMKRGGALARILSPVEGTVVAAGGSESDWFLRVKLSEAGKDLRHLLTPREARFWLLKELERLQMCFSGSLAGITLADGGNLVPDVPSAMKEDCAMVWEEMFLQP